MMADGTAETHPSGLIPRSRKENRMTILIREPIGSLWLTWIKWI
jgi:hypothetical protein